MILLDTSALAKLLIEERESPELRNELSSRSLAGDEFVISTLAVIELRRLAIRLAVEPERVEPVIRPFRVLRLAEGILQLAGRFPYRQLGTLDALHVATALVVEAQTVMTYDVRQAEAARNEGLIVIQPAL